MTPATNADLAKGMFTQAVAFQIAAKRAFEMRLNANMTENFIAVPGIVSFAFALECYLKAIAQAENGTFRRAHHLAALFNDLNPATQRALETAFNKRSTRALKGILRKADNAFVDWRYIFEKENLEASPKDLADAAMTFMEHLEGLFPGHLGAFSKIEATLS